MSDNYGWCQKCGAVVVNSQHCHRCGGTAIEICVETELVKQAKRIAELEDENIRLKERIEEVVVENKKLRDIKCPPISDGDTCICPIEKLEAENENLKSLLEQLIFIAEKSTTDDAEDTTIELANQALKG